MIFNLLDFLVFLKDATILYLTLLGATAAFWLLARRVDRNRYLSRSWFASSMVLGPLALSWLTVMLLAVLPPSPAWVYPVVLCALTWPFLLTLPRTSQAGLRGIWRNRLFLTAHPYRLLVLALLLLGLPTMFVVLALFPPSGNDTLEYLQVAQKFFEQRSSRGYPYLDSSVTGGFLSPWTHPPGYPGLLSIGYFIQGHTQTAAIALIVVPWLVVGQLLCLVELAGARRYSAGLLAALLLLGTPLYYDVAVVGHVDILRIAGLTAAVLAAQLVARDCTMPKVALLGLAVGLAMFSHSIGLLTLPLVGLVFVTLSWFERRPLTWIAGASALIAIIGVLVVAPQLQRNLAVYGTILADHVKLWDIKELRVAEFLFATRFMVTVWDRVFVGALPQFTNLAVFGASGLLALGALTFAARDIWRAFRRTGLRALTISDLGGRALVVPALVTLAFLGVAVLSALAGSTLIVKNPRYILTVQPFIALLAAHLIINLMFWGRRSQQKGSARPAAIEHLADAHDRLRNLRLRRSDLALRVAESMPEWMKRAWRSIESLLSRTLRFVRQPWSIASLVLVLVTLWSGSQIGVVIYRDLVSTHGISGATLLDSELIKRRSIPWPQVRLEEAIRAHVPAEDRTLVFRQADPGYYLRRPMLVYVDDKLLDIYRMRDANTAAAKLREHGIKWIYVPRYPMPEIYNSVFGSLLTDPGLARLVVDKSGWRLFQIMDTRLPVTATDLRTEDFEANPELGLRWQTLEPRSFLTKLIFGFGRDATKAGPPSASAQQAFFTNRGFWRTLTPREWPDDNIETAFLTMTSDFEPKPGMYRLNAEIEGTGLVEISLMLDDRFALTLDGDTTPIWSGVLSNERRKVSGVFLIEDDDKATLPVLRERLAQVLWRVHQRASMRLLNWKLERIADEHFKPLGQADAIAAIRQGWLVSKSGVPAGSTQPAAPEATAALRSFVLPFAVKRLGSGSLELTSPDLVATGTALQSPAWSQLELTATMLAFSADVRGQGVFDIDASLTCRTALATGRTLRVKLGRVLATERSTTHQFKFVPSCWPIAVQLRFTNGDVAHRFDKTRLDVSNVNAAMTPLAKNDDTLRIEFRPAPTTVRARP